VEVASPILVVEITGFCW